MTIKEALDYFVALCISNRDKEGAKRITFIKNKLNELKDIEEELGIDLIILFKALTDAVYYRDEDNDINISYFPYLGRNKYYFIFNRENTVYLIIKDYGKTWALTAGELQND